MRFQDFVTVTEHNFPQNKNVWLKFARNDRIHRLAFRVYEIAICKKIVRNQSLDAITRVIVSTEAELEEL